MTFMIPAQLTFDFPALARDPAGTFVEGPSTAEARAALAQWRSWPAHALALVGPAHSGKSHIAAVWAASAPSLGSAAIVDGRAPGFGAAATNAVEAGGRAVVEQADHADAEALFALINAARRGAGALLLTARCDPDGWAAWDVLADLTSRLRALPVARIAPPSDEELRAILVKLFADRGIRAEESLLSYVCVRIERSHAAAVDAADALTRHALAEGVGVTRALARAHFQNGGPVAL